jgi:hypothetical protein
MPKLDLAAQWVAKEVPTVHRLQQWVYQSRKDSGRIEGREADLVGQQRDVSLAAQRIRSAVHQRGMRMCLVPRIGPHMCPTWRQFPPKLQETAGTCPGGFRLRRATFRRSPALPSEHHSMQDTQPSTSVPSSAICRNRM